MSLKNTLTKDNNVKLNYYFRSFLIDNSALVLIKIF